MWRRLHCWIGEDVGEAERLICLHQIRVVLGWELIREHHLSFTPAYHDSQTDAGVRFLALNKGPEPESSVGTRFNTSPFR